jgi:hypothetical protein
MSRPNQGYQNPQFKIEGGPNQGSSSNSFIQYLYFPRISTQPKDGVLAKTLRTGQAGYGTAQSSAPYNPYPSQPQVTPFAQPHQPPYYSEPHQQGYAHAPTTNGGHYQPQNGYQAPQQPSQFYSGAAIHQAGQQQQQHLSGPSPVHTMPQPHPSYEPKDPINTRPAPSLPTGMFTRNLIGSLAASAFRLTDPDDRIGIWFVLQDLSVRTEGQFRLRFSFVNVGLSPGMVNPSSSAMANVNMNVNANQINTGKVPVLATCYSDVFTVFSAKKFPGVVESTHLSKVSYSLSKCEV